LHTQLKLANIASLTPTLATTAFTTNAKRTDHKLEVLNRWSNEGLKNPGPGKPVMV
jgi:hypothetical protein